MLTGNKLRKLYAALFGGFALLLSLFYLVGGGAPMAPEARERFVRLYPPAAGAAAALWAGALLRSAGCFFRGEGDLLSRGAAAFCRYGYLLRQLIARDFKSKYKRSVLGVLWSFLNPLLTMAVQYMVFSTVFRSDIPNFPLYLLTGIVCFGYFSETCSMTLMSIVGSASLITKVYVPKYIFPLSRALSSMINLLLSLIPLLAVMILTRTPLRPSALLLPFPLVCLLMLCLGLGLGLSAMMVFFRDTQFLWGVVSLLWMYATPIFYPESIIPSELGWLLDFNPLCHIIRFMRTLLMEGVSPEPRAYGLCLLSAGLPLLAGGMIFRRTQDRFVLNL